MTNTTKKNFLHLSLFLPFSFALAFPLYADPCSALGNINTSPTAVYDPAGGLPKYPVTSSAGNVSIFISLESYANVINAALTGQPLPVNGGGTETSIPACAGLTTVPGQFTPGSGGRMVLSMGVRGSILMNGTNAQYFQLTDPATNFSIAATVKYCNCNTDCNSSSSQGFFTPVGGETSTPNLSPNALYTAIYHYSDLTSGTGNVLGVCGDIGTRPATTGALYFQVYSPTIEGQVTIPPIGTYTSNLILTLGPH